MTLPTTVKPWKIKGKGQNSEEGREEKKRNLFQLVAGREPLTSERQKSNASIFKVLKGSNCL